MKSTSPSITSPRKRLPASAAVALVAASALPSLVLANTPDECAAGTLRGVYRFHASGYNIVNGAALPKAIIETLVFDGYGNVTTPAVSLSVNGTIIQPPQG